MHDKILEEPEELEKKLTDSGFTQNQSHPFVWDNKEGVQINTNNTQQVRWVSENLG